MSRLMWWPKVCYKLKDKCMLDHEADRRKVFARQLAAKSVSPVCTFGWFPVWHSVGRLWLCIFAWTTVIFYNSDSDLCQHCEILEEGNSKCALRCCRLWSAASMFPSVVLSRLHVEWSSFLFWCSPPACWGYSSSRKCLHLRDKTMRMLMERFDKAVLLQPEKDTWEHHLGLWTSNQTIKQKNKTRLRRIRF